MVILNSPANPTGGVIPREDLEAHRRPAARPRRADPQRRDLLAHLLRRGAASITQFDGMLEKTIILDGFSKTYSMTGWRLGYGVMPLWLVDAVDKLMVNSNSCTASFTQRAGMAALEGPQDDVDTMVAEFRRRRDAIVEGPERDSRVPLHGARGRVLCVPERHGDRRSEPRPGRHAAQRRRRGVPERDGVRQLRRRLPAIQLRELAGEHPGSAGRIRKLSERWSHAS